MKFPYRSLFILALLLLSGCGSIPNKTSCVAGNCTDGKGQLNTLYQNTLFKIQVGTFVNGKLHGKGKKEYYNRDGGIDRVYDGTYKQGLPHGNMTYISYANQQIASRSNSIYIEGKEEGAFLYKSYRQGKLAYEQRGRYKNGKKEGVEINVLYDHNGIGSDDIIRHYVNGRKVEE